MMIAIYIMLTLIFTVLLCITKEISTIAKILERFDREDGDGSRE